ncbi:MAG: lysine--tRNA ligase [Chlamydiae bacterium]|nr:lysine--tRNA ligase [Chlamydiota bacterium]
MTMQPEYHSYEEFRNRLQKLSEIQALGIEPYPAKFTPTGQAGDLSKLYAGTDLGHSEDAAAGNTAHTTVSGRLVLFRAMGKNAFGHIQDESGRLQIMFNKDLTKVEGLAEGDLSDIKFIEKKLDLGDIIGVEGNLFYTQKGELTLFAKKVTLLCKTLLPLPDKHSGLTDKGVRYRKRWLDLISHPETMNVFQKRSSIFRMIRQYFEKVGFMEVETPVLQNMYGGAQARPFTSYLNALDQNMFLRIALELPLKKLIVGGFNKVYEIGKVFRNEGIDKTHNPEFTMLEAYAAYWDYHDMMMFTENLFEEIAMKLYGTTQLQYKRESTGEAVHVDVKAPWIRLSMKESIKTYGKIDVDTLADQQIHEILKKKGVEETKLKNAPRGILIALLFEEFVEEHLIQPHHIIDHPIETTPLCKLHRNPELRKENFVERFETFILGTEFCNSYSELNDPVLQRSLLEDQARKKEAGDEEANPLDEEFIESICQGMPPTGGLGIGLDRLVMLFTGSHSIRDVLFFPIMRHEET